MTAQFEGKTFLLLWATELGHAAKVLTGPVWLQGYSNYQWVTGVWSSCLSSHAVGEFLGCRLLGTKKQVEDFGSSL